MRRDGSVACWGCNGDGRAHAPGRRQFSYVSAGVFRHTCGVKPDGSVASMDEYGDQATPPARRSGQSVPTDWNLLRGEAGRLRRPAGAGTRGPGDAAGRGVRLRQRRGEPHLRGDFSGTAPSPAGAHTTTRSRGSGEAAGRGVRLRQRRGSLVQIPHTNLRGEAGWLRRLLGHNRTEMARRRRRPSAVPHDRRVQNAGPGQDTMRPVWLETAPVYSHGCIIPTLRS